MAAINMKNIFRCTIKNFSFAAANNASANIKKTTKLVADV